MKFQAFGIDIWNGPAASVVAQFANPTGITYPLLVNGGDTGDAYNIDRQYIVIDTEGVVRYVSGVHELNVNTIRDIVDQYLPLDEPTFDIEIEHQTADYINYTENPDTLARYNSIHFDATLTVLSDSHVNVVFELTPRAEQIAELRQFSICWANLCQQPRHGIQTYTDNSTYEPGFVDTTVQFSIYPQVSDDDEPPHIPVIDYLVGDYTFDVAVYDADNPEETRYEFELTAHDLAGQSISIKPVIMPESHKLLSNYPNPFNPSTTVRFIVEQAGPVKVTVYDILGRTVAQLVNSTMSAGAYSTYWNAKSSAGVPLPSGSYWVMLNTPSNRAMHRIVLIR